MITRFILFGTLLAGFVANCAAQTRYRSDLPAALPRPMLAVNGVNFPQTESGLQTALNALAQSCGTVQLPASMSIEITVDLVVPPCSGGTNILAGSGDTTILHLATASARIVQSSGTWVKSLQITSSQKSAVAGGGLYSVKTSDVEASDVTFSGGGPQIAYQGVSNFTISGTQHFNLTAPGNAILVNGSDHGVVSNAQIEGFTAPASATYYGGAILVANGSSEIAIVNPVISDIDGTAVPDYAGVDISASHSVSVLGGTISGLKNGDGVVTEDGTTDVNISGTTSTGHSNASGVGLFGNNGDGFDIYNSARVELSDCVGSNNGNLSTNLQHGAEIFSSEDVTISNCEFSGNGAEGIIVAGSPRTKIVDVTSSNNCMAGAYFEHVSGSVNVSGAQVTLTNGIAFGLAWEPGTQISIQSQAYKIASVTDGSHLLLATSAGTLSGATYSLESYQAELSGGSFNNNGTGGVLPHGIYLADATTASVSNTTATNEAANGSTQMWGANVQNQAQATFFRDDFRGNAAGEIQDGPGISQEFDMVTAPSLEPCCRSRARVGVVASPNGNVLRN